MQLNVNQSFLFSCVFMGKENSVPQNKRKRNNEARHFGCRKVVILGLVENISNIKCQIL